jgi:hypothetical protein
MYELTLWEKLKRMGFTPLTHTHTYSRWERLVNWLCRREPLKVTSVYNDYLVATIDGKAVHISCHAMDFGYVDMTINGRMVFSQRRFNDEDLFSLLPIEPIKITPKQKSFKFEFV